MTDIHQTMTRDGPTVDRLPVIIALAFLTNPGAAVGVIAPTIVSAFVAKGFPLATATLLGASEMAGMTIALLGAPLLLGRVDRRMLVFLAVIVAALGQFLSLPSTNPAAIGVFRAIAGVGEGGLYATAIATLATTRTPDKSFGIVMVANQIAGTVMLAAIVWISAWYPKEGPIIVASALVITTAIFISAIPSGSATSGASSEPRSGRTRQGPGLMGLGAMLLLSFGFGAVWPIITQIGVARGVTPATMAAAFSVVGVAGIAAGLIVAWIGARFGRILPLVTSSGGLAVALLISTHNLPFAFVLGMIMFFWTASVPYYFGVMAGLDESGRLTVLSSAMIPLGITIGQSLAGRTAAEAGFGFITTVAAAAIALALLIVSCANRMSSREASHSAA